MVRSIRSQCQILGIPQAGSRTIVRDEPQGAIYFSLNADGRLTQLVAFNNARIVKLAKRWMAAGRDLSNVRSLTRLSR